MSETKQPEKKFRAGPIQAAVWDNVAQSEDGQARSYKTITFERSYKDKDGNWKSTHTLRTGDLPRLTLLATKAYEYLSLSENDGVIVEKM